MTVISPTTAVARYSYPIDVSSD